jgi:hypothetical protein
MMKHNKPNCFIVTRCPRTPHDQGSVESANKLVQRVMKSISLERCLAGLEVNWTNYLDKLWLFVIVTQAKNSIAFPILKLFLDCL